MFFWFFVALCVWIVILGIRNHMGRVVKEVPINFENKFNHLLNPEIYRAKIAEAKIADSKRANEQANEQDVTGTILSPASGSEVSCKQRIRDDSRPSTS